MNEEQALRPKSGPAPEGPGGGVNLRERALQALRAKQFDLAEEILSRQELDQDALIENLRIYQTELELQNEELLQSQERTQRALARFAAFFNTLPIAELVIDRQGLIHEANPAAQRVFGLDRRHLRHHFFARLIAEPDRHRVVAAWTNLAQGSATLLPEVRLLNGEGGEFIGDIHIAILPALGEDDQHYVCAVIDRTESVRQRQLLQAASDRLRESHERYRVLADFSSDWEFWRGADGHCLYVSPACERISGYAPQDFISDPGLFGRLVLPEDRQVWQAHLERIKADPGIGEQILELRIRTRDGAERWLEHLCTPVIGEDGRFLGRRGVNRDITERKRFEEQLEYLAQHDALTGLVNRAYFQVRLEQCLQRARRYRRQCALLFIDLDRFKEVNDTLGHGIGDALLRQVADLLKGQIRAVDTLARLGGDEFVVILEDIPEPRFAAHFAERILGLFGQPLKVEGHRFLMTASIGISLYPGDAQDAETLVQHADLAMYQAKHSGRNAFSFFEPSMSKGVAERLHLEQDLRQAIAQCAFVLYYQPQVELATGRLVGIEALARWPHPRLGLLLPDQFLPVAEDLGLIEELSLDLLRRSCKQFAEWSASGLIIPRLSLNLAVRDLDRQGLVDRIAAILQETGVEPSRLELEISESRLRRCSEGMVQTLNAIRDLGPSLALDDFGSGCSAVRHLPRLPLRRLKIDRALVQGIGKGDEKAVRALIGIARAFGFEVMAEGIETQEQAEFLMREGCPQGTGHLYGAPMPPNALIAFLRDR